MKWQLIRGAPREREREEEGGGEDRVAVCSPPPLPPSPHQARAAGGVSVTSAGAESRPEPRGLQSSAPAAPRWGSRWAEPGESPRHAGDRGLRSRGSDGGTREPSRAEQQGRGGGAFAHARMEAVRTPRLRCWGAPALVLALISSVAPQASSVAEWHPGPKSTPDTLTFGLEGSRGALDPIPARGLPDPDQEPPRNATGQEGDGSEDKTWKATEAQQSPKTPPVDSPDLAPAASTAVASAGEGGSFSLSGSALKYNPSGANNENNETSACLGCSGEIANERLQPDAKLLLVKHNEGASEASAALGSVAGPAGREAAAQELSATREAAESQEDMGSGDQRLGTPAVKATFPSSAEKKWDLGAFTGSRPTTLLPVLSATAGDAGTASEPGDKSISPDSAETDHLLRVLQEVDPPSPLPGGKAADPDPQGASELEVATGPGKEEAPSPSAAWVEAASRPPAHGGTTDLTLRNEELGTGPQGVSTPPPEILKPPEPSSQQSWSEIIDADYYDPSDLDGRGDLESFPGSSVDGPGGDSTKKVPGKKPPPWAVPDLYGDFFTTFDESDFYPTASFYTDGDEEGGADDDDEEEEDMEAEDGALGELENGNDPKVKTFTPKIQTTVQNGKPTGMLQVPQQTFVVPQGGLNPKSQPETMKEPTQASAGSSNGSSSSSSECRNGYLRHNRTCKSVCDVYPTYCYNGGQCYLVENSGAFCRCNTQDYIWHKGVRCESIITDFQVMCVAVGTAALVVLLLFMMTVFFAKKLYLLKTENYKLRKRKYRTPSELHNDNFSLSTIAEGSHPNEDPNAIHKLQDPTKPSAKEEEPFNIQNSLSPKHDSDKGGHDSLDVNCLQNNLT
ncbi:chondroitin sulfate proteoglycan 5 isoform X2 [Rhinatrema bivittatum]|uniref:chondroitin sulfate proteoglycan 5 isoform X2 n=1 Tax=Rhinatrema bivittatum TaxID=194408 RepID=UPI0011276E80|nr:chondroitin sulfate proteoglycan 5 isoform X2 [Rhinatrema bivittatum]